MAQPATLAYQIMDLIIGMHRSGTSLSARLLHRAGADLGPAEGFIEPDRWNPDGYFEQREILMLNRQILHGPWGKFVYLALPSSATVCRRGRGLAARLALAARRFDKCLVKDPRFCVTAPAWEAAGARFGKILICLREPWEVAQSLWRRNRLPVCFGLRLWRRHFELNLKLARTKPHWWVSYDRLLSPADCITEVAGMARFLGLPFDEQRDGEWVRGIVRPRRVDGRCPPPSYSPRIHSLLKEVRDRHFRQ